MDPRKWFRWKILVVVVALVGLFYFLALDPLAHSEINELGTGKSKPGARWHVDALDLRLLFGDLDFEGVAVAAPARSRHAGTAKARVFSADGVRVDFDMEEVLRKRVHGDFELRMPKLTIERRPDGTINVHDIGNEEDAEEEETPPSARRPTDWVGATREWFEKLERWVEKAREIRDKIGRPEKDEDPETLDYSRRVTYPFDDVVRFVARSVVGSGLEIHFVDGASDTAPALPALTDGRIEIHNVSEKPFVQKDPVTWVLSGNLAGATVRISGDLSLSKVEKNGAWSVLNLRANIQGLPLQLVESFASTSLPVRFDSGTLNLEADLSFWDFERLSVEPKLGFVDAVMKPRPGVEKIAGFDADRVCRTFNEVGTLELNDMKVRGTFRRPQIEVGKTFQNLIVSGAKAFVSKQAEKGLDRATQKAQEEAGRLLDRVGGSKILEGVTGKDDDSTIDDVKSGVGDALKGFLGGDRKKDGEKE